MSDFEAVRDTLTTNFLNTATRRHALAALDRILVAEQIAEHRIEELAKENTRLREIEAASARMAAWLVLAAGGEIRVPCKVFLESPTLSRYDLPAEDVAVFRSALSLTEEGR